VSNFRAVLADLEGALQSGSPGRRTEVLRRVTDLFTVGESQLSGEQISLFDDVLGYLVAHIEKEALTELSARLAPAVKAPPRIVRSLARHDSIEVAGPILTRSEQLTEQDLVEIAKTKGQAHQLTIAARPQLTEAVTEVLIDRGDYEVVNTVAGNNTARFSDQGFSKLVLMATGDDRLTTTVARRSDLPPRLFREILSQASDTVREKLLAAAAPEKRENLKKILNDISSKLGTGVTTKHYAKAQQAVRSFSQDTAMTKLKLREFARAKMLDETVVTLSTLTAVPIELVDRLFYGGEPHGVMVLCRLMGLDWSAARLVVWARPQAKGMPEAELDALEEDYKALSPQTAHRLVRFWQARQDTPVVPQRRPREVVVLPI
jgi:uncharacterized protein (DUF2336 family)